MFLCGVCSCALLLRLYVGLVVVILVLRYAQSIFSFTIALNARSEYAGGGTYFTSINRTLNVDVGHAILFAGGMQHAGAQLTSGRRYILVLFLGVYDHPLPLYVS